MSVDTISHRIDVEVVQIAQVFNELVDSGAELGPHSVLGKMEQDRRKIEILEFIQYCHVIGADPQEGLEVMIQSMSGESRNVDA